jgi:arsenate reductase-like glutaredoxin family protein
MVRDINANVSLAKQEYNFSVKKYDEGDISAEDLEQIFLKANSKVKEIYSEMKEVWKDAEKLGVSKEEFWNTMESKSIPKEVRSQVLYDNKVSGFYRKR